MKTLEIIYGQKVWAVDATEECIGCMFSYGSPECLFASPCSKFNRHDNRDVIFQPYEEQQEKTFTLSQINEVINEVIIKGGNIPWNASLRVLQSKLERL